MLQCKYLLLASSKANSKCMDILSISQLTHHQHTRSNTDGDLASVSSGEMNRGQRSH